MPVPKTFEEAQQIFAEALQGYTRRAHQILLAGHIEQALADGKHGLFQAGTGTGKSFALLIPAILSGKRTVVATFNKALQNQYIKDLTFLTEYLGVKFRWAILKGRANYPCLAKIKDLRTQPWVNDGQRQVLSAVARELEAGYDPDRKIVDREDFPGLTEDDWKPFSMSSSECPGRKHCPFGAKCFAEQAKDQAAEADIVITNSAFFLQDLILRDRTDGNVALLGEFEQVIVDEAHTLPDVTTGALEDTMGEGTFRVLSRDMAGYLMAEGGDAATAQAIENAADQLWFALTTMYDAWLATDPKQELRPMTLHIDQVLVELGQQFVSLYNAIDAAREAIKDIRVFGDDTRAARERLLRRSANQQERIYAYAFDAATAENTVRWVEREAKRMRSGVVEERTYLRSAPISVAPFLRRALWDLTVPSPEGGDPLKVPTVMASATLVGATKRVQGRKVPDFGYLANTLGLVPDETMTYDAGSPFDYPNQAVLFTPDKDMPAPARPTDNEWKGYAQMAMYRLVTRSKGGALLLFTSRKAMEEAWDSLAPMFSVDGLKVMKQGSAPSPEIIRQMKADGNAVVFALRTFFEGVDVQGAALRLVVLDKLPFAAPDPVYDARCAAVNKRYGNDRASFDKLTVPMMTMILLQAVGRLIRHADDRGVMAILDSRLNSKGYGRNIMEALPPAARTSDIEEACAFLDKILA